MSHDEGHDDEWESAPSPDEPEGPPRQPSEGVRILGAQEAAEATGRHDAVRRRDRKRFGDRPDTPEAEGDLPRITISSSEAPSESDAGHFGKVPIVPPATTPPPEEPRWGEPEHVGHARVTDREPTGSLFDDADDGDDLDQGDDESFVLPHWTEPATGQVPKVVIEDDEPLVAGSEQPRWRDDAERAGEPGFDDLMEDPPTLGALGGAVASSSTEDDFFERELDHDPLEAFAPSDSGSTPRRTRGGGGGSGRSSRPPASDGGDRNLVLAIGVGVALLGLGLLCFSLGRWATMLLAAAVVTLAAFEYFTAVREVGYNPASLVGLVAVAALVIGASLAGLAAYPIALGLTVMVGLIWYLLVAPGEGSVHNLGITLLGVMWVGLLGSFAGLFLGLGQVVQDRTGGDSNTGIGVLIAAVIVSVSYDVGAYFIGRFAGRTPLSEASPNKTQEGFFGGIGVAFLLTLIIVQFVGIAPLGGDFIRVLVFALLCSMAAPVGDLCESFVKRDLGIKDMGAVLPGHGGVLDRFDSLLFVLPTSYFVTVLFDVWAV
jgi:phosphatidate cytidylyltransferase